MTSTKTLYATTLLLAGLAGFSGGWAARPPEKVFVDARERRVLEYERAYRLSAEDREELRAVLGRYFDAIDELRREFDRRYEDQLQALADEYDAEIASILTPDKRRK